MNLKSVVKDIHILGFAILQLLEHLDFMDGHFNGIIFGTSIRFVVGGVNVDNFESNDSIIVLIVTRRYVSPKNATQKVRNENDMSSRKSNRNTRKMAKAYHGEREA